MKLVEQGANLEVCRAGSADSNWRFQKIPGKLKTLSEIEKRIFTCPKRTNLPDLLEL